MNLLHMIVMVNLTVPYPGDTTTGDVFDVQLDTAETFADIDACYDAAMARNMNPRIMRNVSRSSVTRTIYRCVSFDPVSLTKLVPSEMPEDMKIPKVGDISQAEPKAPYVPFFDDGRPKKVVGGRNSGCYMDGEPGATENNTCE